MRPEVGWEVGGAEGGWGTLFSPLFVAQEYSSVI